MFFYKSLDQIQLVESDLLINQKKIPLRDIKKVFVTVKKIPMKYEIIYILIGGIFIGLNFSFYPIGFYFWMVAGIYLLGEYLVHNYRTCTLNVELQNEKVQFRHIPYELKYQLVNKINEIKGCM